MGEKTQKINQQKQDRVSEIREIITGAKDIIFADYRGLTVSQLTELRGKLQQELGLPVNDDFLVGPTALTLIKGDAGPVAKILLGFAKELPLDIKGGLVEGRVFSREEITALSTLPGRNELYAKLLGSMNAPATSVVMVLQAVAGKLVRTLQAVADKKKSA
jgi:large subunit ribosomal protein L10